MERQRIIMNFTVPPSVEDLDSIAADALASLPEELARHCENLAVQVEEFPDETTENELELEGPYELVALFRSGNEISPGVKSKVANDDDVLVLFRRPLLDVWAETGEDLSALVRQVMIEEIAQNFEFTDDDIQRLADLPHQGML